MYQKINHVEWKFPFNNLSDFKTNYGVDLLNAVQRVVESGWYVLGPEVNNFELDFSKYLNIDNCVSVANGTDAIEIAMRALGVRAGDLVASVANAGMYSSTAISAINATAKYMDVSPHTHCVTLSEVQSAIDSGVKLVVVTHLYGRLAPEIVDIAKLCKQAGVCLIEDCAQAHGARQDGQFAGTFGDAATFSFYPTKNLGCLGDGGCIVTDKADVADRCRSLRQYGWKSKYNVAVSGGRNSRLDEIQAAILSAMLPKLDIRNTKRQAIAGIYNSIITHPLIGLPDLNSDSYVAHLYVISSSRRDSLREHLSNNGVQTEVHYPIPDHRQATNGNEAVPELLVTDDLSGKILTLPCFPEMEIDAAREIAEAVNRWKA